MFIIICKHECVYEYIYIQGMSRKYPGIYYEKETFIEEDDKIQETLYTGQ